MIFRIYAYFVSVIELELIVKICSRGNEDEEDSNRKRHYNW